MTDPNWRTTTTITAFGDGGSPPESVLVGLEFRGVFLFATFLVGGKEGSTSSVLRFVTVLDALQTAGMFDATIRLQFRR